MNFFNYESKPMQILMLLADLIILNLLYLLCCIPIFTIGAAQAGLYTGIKTLLDPEDDTYCSTAFFKGFKSGFKNITIAWSVMFAALLVLGYVTVMSMYFTAGTSSIPFYAAVTSLCILALFQSLLPVFHSRFNCTPWQLIRNTWFLTIAHPLRSLLVGVLTWFPLVLLLLINFVDFMAITPIFLLIYYSGAYLFGFSAMKKPMKTLIDHYNETHNPQPEASAEENEAETEPDDSEEVLPEE